MIHDSNGVPTYADANDAKEKLSPRIKEEVRASHFGGYA